MLVKQFFSWKVCTSILKFQRSYNPRIQWIEKLSQYMRWVMPLESLYALIALRGPDGRGLDLSWECRWRGSASLR